MMLGADPDANRFPDDVDERSELECAEARLRRQVREETANLCFGMYLLGAEDEYRSVIATLLSEGFTRRQAAESIIRLRDAA